MVFGYTRFDPVIVLLGTLYAAYLLSTRPVRLMAFLPFALSVYFFIPLLTYLTLWQTVPLLLIGRLTYFYRVRLSAWARPVIVLLVLLFGMSLGYAVLIGADTDRAIIRSLFYFSAIALFLFSYEMALKQEGYDLFIRGLVAVAILYAIYGAYQIFAFYTGLPVRGIVYGPNSSGLVASESGIPRINSLANEPKRLGYVMFLGALACFTLAQERFGKTRLRLKIAGGMALALSVLTFSGSYFLAIALFVGGATLLYPNRMQRAMLAGVVFAGLGLVLGPGQVIIDALQSGVERRALEVEVGLEGKVVYRQEFFAIDYLANHPLRAITGVGVGQYYRVLNKEYGTGVGFNEFGGLMPLNSMLLEMLFDIGGIASGLLYGGLGALILQLRRRGFVFLTMALLFLTLQSLTIQTLLFIAVVAGVGVARLRVIQTNQAEEVRLPLARKPLTAP